MLKGIATRNYEACAEAVPEAFGSVALIGVPSLRERHGSKAGPIPGPIPQFQERSLGGYDLVALLSICARKLSICARK